MPIFPSESLHRFARSLFEAGGVPPDEAETVAASLTLASLSGHDSHGLLRVPQYMEALADGRLRGGAPLTVLHETPALLSADGNWGLGQVQMYRLLDLLRPKAAALGVSVGTLRHCGHTGRLGEYAEFAAEHDLALIATVNSHGFGPRVAPPGGTEARLSTNPLCMGAPLPEGALVLDIGTCVAAEGKVRVYHQKGEPVPAGWLLDEKGRPTTDPGVLYREPRGSILPLGGAQAYKGFGLSLLLDLLAGGLSGGGCTRADAPPTVGNAVFVVLLDPAHFGGADAFRQTAGCLAEFVRSSPCAEGVSSVQLPGDPERRERQRRRREGVPVTDETWRQLLTLAGRLGVEPPC